MSELSSTMHQAVDFIRKHGKICRYPGGFWCQPSLDLDPRHAFSFGTRTVEGLVTRGVAKYTEWQDGRNGRFPITAELVEK